MLISIIVPVYNVEQYIVRCFDSIAKQKYHHIECIFIDDCSSDNSYNILKMSIDNYSGAIAFYIVRHDVNKGLSEARNTGIYNAKGEYLYFLDSDDEITENCIQYLVILAEKYKNVDIVQGNAMAIPRNQFYDITKRGFPEYTNNRLWLKKHFFVEPRIPVNATNKFIKRSFIRENHFYFKRGIIHEDQDWMFFAAKQIRDMAFTINYCYLRYVVPGSIMQSGNNLRSVQSWLLIIEDILLNIDIEVLQEQRKYIYAQICYNISRINATSEHRLLLSKYKRIIKILIKDAAKSFHFINVLGLAILLLPYPVYNNVVFKNLSRLMLSNLKNVWLKIINIIICHRLARNCKG
jgi:glycosyltransferase involved in cell wall biosynthesis